MNVPFVYAGGDGATSLGGFVEEQGLLSSFESFNINNKTKFLKENVAV